MNTTTRSITSTRQRVASIAAGFAVAVGALAPSAHAVYYKPRVEPPDCTSSIANVVNDDPICEATEQQP